MAIDTPKETGTITMAIDCGEDLSIPKEVREYHRVRAILLDGRREGYMRAADLVLSFRDTGYTLEHIASCIRCLCIPDRVNEVAEKEKYRLMDGANGHKS